MSKKPSKYVKLVGESINNIKINSLVKTVEPKFMCECHCGKVFQTRCYAFTKVKPITSCGCLRVILAAEATRGKPAHNRLPNFLADKNDLFYRYGVSAKNRNLSFELEFEDFCNFLDKNCYYCNESPSTVYGPTRKGNKPRLLYNGIDRKDSTLGYTLENCVSCCEQCNYAKSDYNESEFKAWIMKVFNNIKV